MYTEDTIYQCDIPLRLTYMHTALSSYDNVDCHDNFSDHTAVKCVLDVKVRHANRTSPCRDNNCNHAWSKAFDLMISNMHTNPFKKTTYAILLSLKSCVM